MTHELKIERQWADAKLGGEKPFEIRRNDRGFQKGDRVRYTVVDPKTHEHVRLEPGVGIGTERHALEGCEFEITYVREGADNGLQPGYCVFADRPVPAPPRALGGYGVAGTSVRTVRAKDGTVIGLGNFRAEPGDSEELLDAKLEFCTVNRLTVADDVMLRRVAR